MAVTASQACSVVDALVADNLDVLQRINRKFAALRNLAALLEQLGDIQGLIPNIAALVPVAAIDFSLYSALAAQCPLLNLPAIAAGGSTAALQALVAQAYANMVNRLIRHPWNRARALQAQMDAYFNAALGTVQGGINGALSQSLNLLTCLQAVCATGQAVASQLQSFSDANVAKQIGLFRDNFAAHAGSVLSPDMTAKAAELQAAQDQLAELGASNKPTYDVLKARLASAAAA